MMLSVLDWIVILFYVLALIILSFNLSKSQKSKEDYFLAGKSVGSFKIACSVLATQCSTSSILGAPAFVAFVAGGGLIWLQYELAIPLAMIFIMIFIFPIFYRLRLISIYEYLEIRFDLKTRLILSLLFHFIRVFAASVIVYSLAIVIELITGLNFLFSVLILGVVTIVYDVAGGVKAIIYSDLIQMLILTSILVYLLFFLAEYFGGFSGMFEHFPEDRKRTINFDQHGIGDGQDFAFWPMLIGGFFLYVSYYGCDQSQVQREFCAKNQEEGQKILFLNGFFRFPLVLLYCLVGVGIGSFARVNENFINQLSMDGLEPNFNLAVPNFFITNLPPGLVGISIVALFAAAMSSIDSVINSLSATSMEDFVKRFRKTQPSHSKEIFMSRILTTFWGMIAIFLSFFVDNIASNVLIAINKIGSLANGPILGVFILGLFTTKANGNGACIGLVIGFIVNLLFWNFLPDISWLWWNVIGFAVTFLLGLLFSYFLKTNKLVNRNALWEKKSMIKCGYNKKWFYRYFLLILWFFLLLIIMLNSFF